jgi:hypothetical protein
LPATARALNTYRVWLVYELFRGSITAKELEWSELQIRDFVVTRKAANPHLYAAVGIRQAGEEAPQNNSATSKLPSDFDYSATKMEQ